MSVKRGIIISDLHCGHLHGTTPDRFRLQRDPMDPNREKCRQIQMEMWNWVKRETRKYGPYDFCIANGDLVDGLGRSVDGREALTTDMNLQVDMATEVLQHLDAKEYRITFGTKYHTSPQNWEKNIGDKLGCRPEDMGNILQLDVNGLIMNCRHHIGTSSSPQSMNTAPIREALQSLLKAEKGMNEKADCFVFSHRHKASDCSWLHPWQRIIVTPGMQGPSIFGEQRCSGPIDIGFVVLTVRNRKDWECKLVSMPLEFLAPTVNVI